MSSTATPSAPPSSSAPSLRPDYRSAVPARPPLGERVNLRLIALISLLALPFLWVGYVVVTQSLSGGVERRADYYEVDLKSLGNFPFDDRKDTLDAVPKKYRELDGKRVALAGEMFLGNDAGARVGEFQLVYSISKCCFGGPPKVQERVFARIPAGQKMKYYPVPVRVIGTLHVKLERAAGEDGPVTALYTMDVEDIQPAV